MLNPFKKKESSDVASLTSSHDSIAEEKKRISKAVDKSGLQFSIALSSVMHSLEHNDCGKLVLYVHNPTKRTFALLEEICVYDGFAASEKSTLYEDIAAGTVYQQPKYVRNLQFLTIDMGWTGLQNWGSIFRDWKFRPKMRIIGPGCTYHKIYLSSRNSSSDSAGITMQDPGFFEWKSYPVTLSRDFEVEWDHPEFQASLKSSCFDARQYHLRTVCTACENRPRWGKKMGDFWWTIFRPPPTKARGGALALRPEEAAPLKRCLRKVSEKGTFAT